MSLLMRNCIGERNPPNKPATKNKKAAGPACRFFYLIVLSSNLAINSVAVLGLYP